MKYLGRILALCAFVTVCSAEPDWDAIKQKYVDIEEGFRDYSKKALDILRAMADAKAVSDADRILRDFLEKAVTLYRAFIFPGIQEKTLTTAQVKEVRNKLNDIGDAVNDQFKQAQKNVEPAVQKLLDDLGDKTRNYRWDRVKEVIELLKENTA